MCEEPIKNFEKLRDEEAKDWIVVTEHWCNHRAKKLRSGVADIEITPGQLNVIKYIIIRHYIYIIERQRCGLWD